METASSWNISSVEVRLQAGDIFDFPTEAIVNSEQTDFILSDSPDTVSGQIWHRWGSQVQDELDRQNGRAIRDPGTILVTRVQGLPKVIYHGVEFLQLLPGSLSKVLVSRRVQY